MALAQIVRLLHRRYFMKLSKLIFPLLFITTLAAQEPEAIPAPETTETATVETPQKKTEILVIGTEETIESESRISSLDIDRSNAVDPAQAAAIVPGVHFIRKSGIAHNLVIRDAKKDSFSSTVDGMELWGACPNRMDPPTFHTDFSQVKSLNVVKGPFNVSQPNAAAGSLDIETYEPGEQEDYLEAEVSYGSYNQFSSSLIGNFSAGPFSLIGGATHRSSNVYLDGNGDTVTSSEVLTDKATYRDAYTKEDTRLYNVNTYWATAGFSPVENQQFTVGGSYQDATDTLYPYLLMDAPVDTFQSVKTGYTVKDMGKIEEIEANVYYNRVDHLMDNNWRALSETMMFMETDAQTYTTGGDVKGSYATGDVKVKAGVDYYKRHWDSDNLLQSVTSPMEIENSMIPAVDTHNVGAFGEMENAIGDSMTYSAGLRLDYATSKANEDNLTLRKTYHEDSSDEASFFTAGGNVQLNYLASDELTLFSATGTASRLPDPEELFMGLQRMGTSPNWVGNSELKAERRFEEDIGARWSNDVLKAQASVFGAYISNYIAQGQAPRPDTSTATSATNKSASSFFNTNATAYGVEAEADYQFVPMFFLTGNIAFTRAQKETNDYLNDKDMGEIAPLTGVLGLRWEKDGIYALVNTEWADKQNFVDTDIQETETPAWATLNLGVGIQKETFGVHFLANNLLDEQYSNHLSYRRDPFSSGDKIPEPGRNFQFRASYRLQ